MAVSQCFWCSWCTSFFINDLFFFIDKAKLANFADDSTIFPNSAEIETLLYILEKESEKVKN